jgi:hypothetical protein
MPDKNPLSSITYSSGVLCEKPDILSTLAVFYDEVWLPYPYNWDPGAVVLWDYKPTQASLLARQERYTDWRSQWQPLFDQQLLHTLPPPIKPGEYPSNFSQEVWEKLEDKIGAGIYADGEYCASTWDIVTGRLAMIIHALYARKPSPEFFVSNPQDTSTSHLSSVLTRSLFQYRIPQLEALRAEQILEVRDYIKDTREGFASYVSEMVDDMETRLKSGLSQEEAAHRTIERKFLPKYNEVRRQLTSKKTGFWSKVLAAGGKFLKIDAAPWTPKFYGSLFETFFGSSDEIAKAEIEARSNANQAFQFLAKLESKVEKVHERRKAGSILKLEKE